MSEYDSAGYVMDGAAVSSALSRRHAAGDWVLIVLKGWGVSRFSLRAPKSTAQAAGSFDRRGRRSAFSFVRRKSEIGG